MAFVILSEYTLGREVRVERQVGVRTVTVRSPEPISSQYIFYSSHENSSDPILPFHT
jgi:hypothetical protein